MKFKFFMGLGFFLISLPIIVPAFFVDDPFMYCLVVGGLVLVPIAAVCSFIYAFDKC